VSVLPSVKEENGCKSYTMKVAVMRSNISF